jgi:hypothetical protein
MIYGLYRETLVSMQPVRFWPGARTMDQHQAMKWKSSHCQSSHHPTGIMKVLNKYNTHVDGRYRTFKRFVGKNIRFNKKIAQSL